METGKNITGISMKGLDIIKKFEDIVLHPYLDSVGVPTIGWGTTHYPNGKAVTMKDAPITAGQAEEFLMSEVHEISVALNRAIAVNRIVLNQNQYDALVSFAYNVGVGGLLGSTLFKKVKVNPKDPTIKDEFEKWVYGTVNRKKIKLAGLVKRRGLESELYFS